MREWLDAVYAIAIQFSQERRPIDEELAKPFNSADFPDLSLVALGDERGSLPSFAEWGADAASQDSLQAFMALAGGTAGPADPSPDTST